MRRIFRGVYGTLHIDGFYDRLIDYKEIFETMDKLIEFVDDYNHNTRLRKLGYKTPAQYLKEEKEITLQRIVS